MPGIPRIKRPVSIKARKPKNETQSLKKHRFESFSRRIARTNIDPIRRSQPDDELDSPSSSYFRSHLEKWSDVNLSDNFVRFLYEVRGKSETLAQLLHHQEAISVSMLKYIEKRDSLSLEPLLSLVSHFAHDLGSRFEAYFSQTISAICSIASTHTDINVIEWAFNCLAWLFKYLSKLLVPDLRQVYDIMSPLLGKSRQKPFVIRFTSEAMSYLIRRAATGHHRSARELDLIVNHILQDLNAVHNEEDKERYVLGATNLFLESIKGPNSGFHSAGSAVYSVVLSHLLSRADRQLYPDRLFCDKSLLKNLTKDLMEHSTSPVFAPILNSITHSARVCSAVTESFAEKDIIAELLATVVAFRRGMYVTDWDDFVAALQHLIESAGRDSATAKRDSTRSILCALASAFQYAPLEVLLQQTNLLKLATVGVFESGFIDFSLFFAKLGRDRFRSFLFPHLQWFISANHSIYEDQIYCLLTMLQKLEAIQADDIACPQSWSLRIVRKFQLMAEIGSDSHDLAKVIQCNTILGVLSHVRIGVTSKDEIAVALNNILSTTLDTVDSNGTSPLNYFALTSGLLFISENEKFNLDMWPSLCKYSQRFGRSTNYWQGILFLVRHCDSALFGQQSHSDILVESATRALSSSSHELRLICLEVLRELVKIKESNPLELMHSIEKSPLDIQNARAVSLLVRKLGSASISMKWNPWLTKAIPSFCFGLFHFRLAQLWDDSASVLKDIAALKNVEDAIVALAVSWLRDPDAQERPKEADGYRPIRPEPRFDYQIQLAFSASVLPLLEADTYMKGSFEMSCREAPLWIPDCRSKAIRILNLLPSTAEKRSRDLSPILLQSFSGLVEDSQDTSDSSKRDVQQTHETSWTRADRKAFVALFSKFKNFAVIYKSTEVHHLMLKMLTNGDSELQKSALSALSSWNVIHLERYSPHLLNLLDDAKFIDELSFFLDAGEESIIRGENRPTLIPILLRLLYGRAISHSSIGSARREQQSRRRSIAVAISRLGDGAFEQFIDIALAPLSRQPSDLDGGGPSASTLVSMPPLRIQYGILNMLQDMIDALGNLMSKASGRIIDVILRCYPDEYAVSSETGLGQEDEMTSDSTAKSSLAKLVRHACIGCCALLVAKSQFSDLQLVLPKLLHIIIGSRLDRFAIENAHSVSGLLKLLAVLCNSPPLLSQVLSMKSKVFDKVADSLLIPSTTEDVKSFVLTEILKKLLETHRLAAENPDASLHNFGQSSEIDDIFHSLTEHMLGCIAGFIKRSPNKELLQSSVNVAVLLAPYVRSPAAASDMIEICVSLLNQSSKRVSLSTKLDALRLITNLFSLSGISATSSLFTRTWEIVSPLFAFYKGRPGRDSLCTTLSALAAADSNLSDVVGVCNDLNSFSTLRLDEPDYDRRLAAFSFVNGLDNKGWTLESWKPVWFNLLFYINDTEDFVLRSNASLSIRHFITIFGAQCSVCPDTNLYFSSVIVPAIRRGSMEESELVRSEYLLAVAHLVRKCSNLECISDLQCLLVDEEEEASVFNNLLHVQTHRRIRAMKRLSREVLLGKISSKNIAKMFIPLIEHFIFNKADGDSAQNLAQESVVAVGELSGWLTWDDYRALLDRYISNWKRKPNLQKLIIRLLRAVIDSLASATKNRADCLANSTSLSHSKLVALTKTANPKISSLASTLPPVEQLRLEITRRLIPPMTDYLHHKDDSDVACRTALAVPLIKLFLILSEDEISLGVPPVILDVAKILKSRSQDDRDLARKVLAELSILLGPGYFGFILKELRTTLQRGYQMHVFGYTLHTILVSVSESYTIGDLDNCLSDIIKIILDNVLGATGKEKDAEGYISKMSEVRHNKGFDCAELVTKMTSVSHLGNLTYPIQALLCEKLDARGTRKIDELLRRINLGILRNESLHCRELLVYCYEVFSEAHKIEQGLSSTEKRPAANRDTRHLIRMSGARDASGRVATKAQVHKMRQFSLEVLRSILQKIPTLQTVNNLVGLLPLINEAMVDIYDDVKISGQRLLATIIKVPMAQIDKNAMTYVAEAVRTIKASPSTNTELAQASLKLISSILRERKEAKVTEKDIAYVLQKIKPDMEESDRQGVTFNFIRAVLSRRVMIPAVYEILDVAASVMVTSSSANTRDQARSVFFQFLMEYPQTESRLEKQVTFLVKNLRYKYPEGRKSVLECLHLVIDKFGDKMIQCILETTFIHLVFCSSNDSSTDCKEMAATLIRNVFRRADEDRLTSFLSLLGRWLEDSTSGELQQTALQCWLIYFKDPQSATDAKYEKMLCHSIAAILSEAVMRSNEVEWELTYLSLQLVSLFCENKPAIVFTESSANLWTLVFGTLTLPHIWIKLSASKLLGTYFGIISDHAKSSGFTSLPIIGPNSLNITSQKMIALTHKSFAILNSPILTEELATQTVKNLAFMGRCFATDGTSINLPEDSGLTDRIDNELSESDDDFSGENGAAIGFILRKAAGILRRETSPTDTSAIWAKKASLQLIASLSKTLDPSLLLPSLPTLIIPLYTLTNAAPIQEGTGDDGFTEKYNAILDYSRSLMDSLRDRVGTELFMSNLQEARKKIMDRREERRVKRKIEAVSMPVKVAERKRKKHEVTRQKRKEKNSEARGRRRGW